MWDFLKNWINTKFVNDKLASSNRGDSEVQVLESQLIVEMKVEVLVRVDAAQLVETYTQWDVFQDTVWV